MTLKKEALEQLSVRAKNLIALEMNCSVITVERWIRENRPNSDLTKKKVIEIISHETGISSEELIEIK